MRTYNVVTTHGFLAAYAEGLDIARNEGRVMYLYQREKDRRWDWTYYPPEDNHLAVLPDGRVGVCCEQASYKESDE